MFVETCEDTFMWRRWGSCSYAIFLCRSSPLLWQFFGGEYAIIFPPPRAHTFYIPLSYFTDHTHCFFLPLPFFLSSLLCVKDFIVAPRGIVPPQHSPPPLLWHLPLQDFFRLEMERGVSREWNYCNSWNFATSEKANTLVKSDDIRLFFDYGMRSQMPRGK